MMACYNELLQLEHGEVRSQFKLRCVLSCLHFVFLWPNSTVVRLLCLRADLVGSDGCDSDAAVLLYVQGLGMLFSQLWNKAKRP